MFCTRCGKDIKEGNAFCEGCGMPVPTEVSKGPDDLVATAALSAADIGSEEKDASIPPTKLPPSPAETAALPGVTPSSSLDSSAITAPPAARRFCTGCGEPIKEGTVFCTKCGKAVRDDPVTAADSSRAANHRQAGNSSPGLMVDANSAPAPKPKVSKGLIIGLVAASIVLLLAAATVAFLLFGAPAVPAESADNAVFPEISQDSSSREGSEGNAASAETPSDDAREAGGEGPQDEAEKQVEGGSELPVPDTGATTTPEPAPAESVEPDFILPDSASRVYSTSELSDLTDWELFIARNEIFARYGRSFKSEELVEYFEDKDWYTPQYSPEAFDAMASPLTAAEKENADNIRSIELARGSQYL